MPKQTPNVIYKPYSSSSASRDDHAPLILSQGCDASQGSGNEPNYFFRSARKKRNENQTTKGEKQSKKNKYI